MTPVKMKNEATGKTADVHPNEVENYQGGGYVLIEPKSKSEPPKKRGRPKKVVE